MRDVLKKGVDQRWTLAGGIDGQEESPYVASYEAMLRSLSRSGGGSPSSPRPVCEIVVDLYESRDSEVLWRDVEAVEAVVEATLAKGQASEQV